jgi:hypothetical protein
MKEENTNKQEVEVAQLTSQNTTTVLQYYLKNDKNQNYFLLKNQLSTLFPIV